MPTPMLTATELKAWLNESRELLLIDTALADDFAVEHLPGAQNACVFEVTFLDQVRALGKIAPHETIVIYGSSERSLASADAAEKLVGAGFPVVYDFRGGLEHSSVW